LFKKVFLSLLALLAILIAAFVSEAAEKAIQLIIDDQPATVEPGPIFQDGRIFVPVRFVAEHLGALVKWDGENETVIINSGGDGYLKGQVDQNPGAYIGISNNLITAEKLKNILDDNKNGDLADYREGHKGDDKIGNDPLVVDLRGKNLYEKTHIPTAVWVAIDKNIAESENVQKLKSLLDEHVADGGAKYIVVYDANGGSSGLAAGVLGAMGLPVKSMMYGFDIAWQGTKFCPAAIRANMEDINGKVIKCGG